MVAGRARRGETGKEEEEERSDMSVLIDTERCTGGTMLAAAGMPPSFLKTYTETRSAGARFTNSERECARHDLRI